MVGRLSIMLTGLLLFMCATMVFGATIRVGVTTADVERPLAISSEVSLAAVKYPQKSLQELDSRPDKQPEYISFDSVLRQYWQWLLLSLVPIGAMALVITHMAKLNRKIGQAKLALEREAHERCRAELVLGQSEDRFRNLVETTHDVVWEVDDKGFFTYVSPQVEALLGYMSEEFVGKRLHNFLHMDQSKAEVQNLCNASDHPPIDSVEHILAHKKGQRVVLQCSAMPFFHANGSFLGYRGISRDVTSRKQLDEALHREKERAQVTVESIADGVVTTDVAGNIEYLNPVACQLTGWKLSLARGRHLLDVLSLIDDVNQEPIADFVATCLAQGRSVLLPESTMLVRRNGEKQYHVEMRLSPLRNRQREVIGVVGVFRDRTEMRQLVKQMAFQASHDALTGLINRYEFEKRLSKSLDEAQTSDQCHVLCYLDLDQFKIVNDTCGHIAGDNLLKQLAQQLQLLVRPTDVFGRLGGDEFGLLIANSKVSEARGIIDGLCKAVKDYRFVWQGKLFGLGVSVGVVSIDAHSGSLTDVLSSADSACYVAKEQGRNRVYIYQSDDAAFHERQGQMQWVHRIRRSFEQERFYLYYQNVVGLLDVGEDFRHCEILLRMRDDFGNEITPMSFIPAAERYHMMPRIDRWVTRAAFQFIQPNIDLFTAARMRFAINLSGQSLCDDHFLNFIINQLDKTGVPPEMLCFEITETAAIANLGRAMRFIALLKSMGCKFSLDDFGSGLSSFSYLKMLPVDYVKIDGSFVKTMLQDPVNFAMVESVNQIGHLMGLKTVAEFVEDQGIFDRLKLMGVDYAQGNAIDHPKPLELLCSELALTQGGYLKSHTLPFQSSSNIEHESIDFRFLPENVVNADLSARN